MVTSTPWRPFSLNKGEWGGRESDDEVDSVDDFDWQKVSSGAKKSILDICERIIETRLRQKYVVPKVLVTKWLGSISLFQKTLDIIFASFCFIKPTEYRTRFS